MPLKQREEQLIEQRNKAVADMRAINDKADGEDRALNAEEDTAWKKASADVDRLKGEIDECRAEMKAQETRAAELAAITEEADRYQFERRTGRGNDNIGNPASERAEERAAKQARAFNTWLRKGAAGLDEEQRTILNLGFESRSSHIDIEFAPAAVIAEKRARAALMMIPEQYRKPHELRALGSTAGSGGDYIPEGFMRIIVDAMQDFSGMRQAVPAGVSQITTADGATLPIPTADDRSNVGHIVAEGASTTSADPTTGAVNLGSFNYSSQWVKVQIQLLDDEAVDIETFIGQKLGERIGRIQNTHMTTGDGSGKPKGILDNTTGAGNVATATAATFVFDDLIKLKHAVDPAHRRSRFAAYMLHDGILEVAKKFKDSNGQYLWMPSARSGEPDRIDGTPYWINQDFDASVATGNEIAAYGAWSHYWIRDVRGLRLIRADELFSGEFQVGFLAHLRTDGAYVDPGSDPIKKLTVL